MQLRQENLFVTIRSEGSLLPPDLLQKIALGAPGVEGMRPEDYYLPPGERINEAVNRAWNACAAHWKRFRAAAAGLREGDPATGLTRERWLLPLFQELGYGRLFNSPAVQIEGKDYPISHAWQHTPIHLVGCGVHLDQRAAGVRGAARFSPHGLAQEFLNRSESHLWAFLSNGLKLRLLRDNSSLTRQAYVEFDLEAMMEGEVYSDFALLWLVCHASRAEAEKPGECLLERWSQTAAEEGARALDQLRGGVEEAVAHLGQGFLSHPENRALKDKLKSGGLSKEDFYRQLLRLVYRLIFLFVAEDRGLLLSPDAPPEARERYTLHYSAARLRRRAERMRGTRHSDLYCGLALVMEKLGGDAGCLELGLPPLGSFLFSGRAVSDLEGCRCANSDLLAAVRALAFIGDGSARRPVSYKELRSDELGSVYEALLELHPDLNADAGTFRLRTASGSERKTTGSYYTPVSLVQCLLDSALDPVLEEAARQSGPEEAVLSLKVCDPACGSGHFLIAAAHRMAKRLASLRTGDEEPSPEALRTALRDVIGRCLYGVDLNEMAVELCKVALWMESLEPGRPLTFLDHHIRCGNSLLGATPALLDGGIPDAAFAPIEGDDKTVCSDYRKRNKEERKGQTLLFVSEQSADYSALNGSYQALDTIPDTAIEGIHRKEERYDELVRSEIYQRRMLLANAWCAAFVWKKRKDAPRAVTQDILRLLKTDPQEIPEEVTDEIRRLADQYGFFHWHLAFPDVFPVPDGELENRQAGWNGGFDVVLGNPPWERVKLQEKEWFAARRPDIAGAPNAAERRRRIESLLKEDAATYALFLEDRRQAEGESHLIRNSGRYPLCGRGDVNTYAVFAETNRLLMGPTGRVGCILPSGIATDDTTKFFFQDLMDSRSLASFYDFENRQKLFPAVDSRMKFALLTLTGPKRPADKGAQFAFFAHRTEDLEEEDRHFTLSAADIALLNPNTRTCPIFRSRRDAELTRAIYRRVPVLIREDENINSWNCQITRTFDMARFVQHARTGTQLLAEGLQLDLGQFIGDETWTPILESKTFWQFEHRLATYDGVTEDEAAKGNCRPVGLTEKQCPDTVVQARYWLPTSIVEKYTTWYSQRYWIAYRDITNTTNERTMVAVLLPRRASDYTVRLIFGGEVTGIYAGCLLANLNSFCFDYVARQSVAGTHFSDYIMKQLPVLPPSTYDRPCPWLPYTLSPAPCPLSSWLLPRVLELTYTAWDLQPFANDCGYDGPPFRWDEERRFWLRCELDAAYFHLYGIGREDAAYILETFPIVKRKDEARYGEFRTKRVILEMFEAMAGQSTPPAPPC